MTPVWLIAEREFRAYTATASFWVALVVGPLVTAAALALSAPAVTPPPMVVAVHAPDTAMARSATDALTEAAQLDGVRIHPSISAAAAQSLDLVRQPDGGLQARFSANFPLSPTARALVVRTIERDQASGRPATVLVADPGTSGDRTARAPGAALDGGVISRFSLVMTLWVTLTGSLGMLLQAVVRERANRALEGLLAAARPWEILLGKLIGVGGVSGLLLAAWLGTAAALVSLVPWPAGPVQAVLAGVVAPAMLIRAAAIYVVAFAFYGVVTVGVGATARDGAAAQNLARPMFAVLLAVFFATIASLFGHAGRLDWLVFVPPFTPFMLLLRPPDELSVAAQLVALGLCLAATVVAGRIAVGRITLTGAVDRGPAT